MECAADAPPFPQRITLELTNRCNLQCGFCPRKYMEPERGDMDVGLAKRLIDEMALHAPVQLVPFFRGETLLHPHWHEILAHAKACGCGPIQLASNATRLTPETGAALLATGLDFVSFSLNPPDPRARAAPERTADYATCRDNVLAFLDRKAKCGAKTVVQVSTVETQSRSPQVQDFVAFWRERPTGCASTSSIPATAIPAASPSRSRRSTAASPAKNSFPTWWSTGTAPLRSATTTGPAGQRPPSRQRPPRLPGRGLERPGLQRPAPEPSPGRLRRDRRLPALRPLEDVLPERRLSRPALPERGTGMNRIPLIRPVITQATRDRVLAVLDSGISPKGR
jgi:hypothetical protein